MPVVTTDAAGAVVDDSLAVGTGVATGVLFSQLAILALVDVVSNTKGVLMEGFHSAKFLLSALASSSLSNELRS